MEHWWNTDSKKLKSLAEIIQHWWQINKLEWSIGGTLTAKNLSTDWQSCTSITSSTRNPEWTRMGLNLGCICLSNGMGLVF
jgi:hypothetical protein